MKCSEVTCTVPTLTCVFALRAVATPSTPLSRTCKGKDSGDKGACTLLTSSTGSLPEAGAVFAHPANTLLALAHVPNPITCECFISPRHTQSARVLRKRRASKSTEESSGQGPTTQAPGTTTGTEERMPSTFAAFDQGVWASTTTDAPDVVRNGEQSSTSTNAPTTRASTPKPMASPTTAPATNQPTTTQPPTAARTTEAATTFDVTTKAPTAATATADKAPTDAPATKVPATKAPATSAPTDAPTLEVVELVFDLDYDTTDLGVLDEAVRTELKGAGVAAYATVPIAYHYTGSIIAAITAYVDEARAIKDSAADITKAVAEQMTTATTTAKPTTTTDATSNPETIPDPKAAVPVTDSNADELTAGVRLSTAATKDKGNSNGDGADFEQKANTKSDNKDESGGLAGTAVAGIVITIGIIAALVVAAVVISRRAEDADTERVHRREFDSVAHSLETPGNSFTLDAQRTLTLEADEAGFKAAHRALENTAYAHDYEPEPGSAVYAKPYSPTHAIPTGADAFRNSYYSDATESMKLKSVRRINPLISPGGSNLARVSEVGELKVPSGNGEAQEDETNRVIELLDIVAGKSPARPDSPSDAAYATIDNALAV